MNDKNLIGQSLGRYHIIEPLGQGGMASVFRAFDTSLERDVAIKVIRPELDETNGDEFLKRFQREARALAQLDHPYILKVLDYGEQDGLPYLVMPFVPGGTLKEKLGRAVLYPEAAAILAPIARALDYAHHKKIIHRDVKPANILISQSGEPLLSDFGIAKMLDTGPGNQLTATGVGIGTPDYMAPEQWMGKADPITDVYSLGVVFYEMVTGHKPYTADTPAAVLLKHLRDPLPRPVQFIPSLPDAVEQVLFKALAKDSANRFQDMGEFAKILEKLARDEVAQIESMPLDQATLQGLDLTLPSSAAETPALPGAQTVAVSGRTAAGVGGTSTMTKPNNQAWKISLAVAGGLVLVTVVCAIFGIVLLFARNRVSKTNNSPTDVVQVTLAPNAVGPKATESGAVVSTPIPSTATSIPAATQVTPITSIEGLPEDVALLKDNNGDLSTSTSQGMKMFSFTTNRASKDVITFYKAEMEKAGWELVNETTSNGQATYFYMKTEKRTVMISIMDQNGNVFVTIMLPPIQ